MSRLDLSESSPSRSSGRIQNVYLVQQMYPINDRLYWVARLSVSSPTSRCLHSLEILHETATGGRPAFVAVETEQGDTSGNPAIKGRPPMGMINRCTFCVLGSTGPTTSEALPTHAPFTSEATTKRAEHLKPLPQAPMQALRLPPIM